MGIEKVKNKRKIAAVGIVICLVALAFTALPAAGTTTNSLTPHDPIYINGNANFTSANGVTGGTGTPNNPFIIEYWGINASGASGIRIENASAYFLIKNCVIRDGKKGAYSGNDGIYLYEAANGRIENVTCSNNHNGFRLSYSSSISIINSRVYENNLGILLSRSSNNTIENVYVYNNGGRGISITIMSNNNTVCGCLVSKQETGVGISSSSNFNKLKNSTISNNSGCGVLITVSCGNNTISNNIISNNSYRWSGLNFSGVKIEMDSYSNRVYHNNFVTNKIQAWDACSNFWDDGYPSGGNYWSDYTGTDANGNGFGDSPYNISGGANVDNYPLITPFSLQEKSIGEEPAEEETYTPTVMQGKISFPWWLVAVIIIIACILLSAFWLKFRREDRKND